MNYEGSVHAAELLRTLIEEQQTDLGGASEEVTKRRRVERIKRQKQHKELAKSLPDHPDPRLRRAFELAADRGALSWLTVLPIDHHGSLHSVMPSACNTVGLWHSFQQLASVDKHLAAIMPCLIQQEGTPRSGTMS